MGLKHFLSERFSLHGDSAQESEIKESIKRNVEFKGSNLWSLIFAIFIASIGLNVNSTAVIIGAMLVSPLMGPIMGVGLGLGINDLELVKGALRNLLIAVIISIGVSTLYFFISPLHEAQSELLARTTPTIWDVLIALFGGLAGILGSTRKEKGNVIPGVAIATALMPPLCTAGFGIAIGNWHYFVGAFYLFFINSVFICISTLIMVRYMKLTRKVFKDTRQEKRVGRLVLTIVALTVLPSIYVAYDIVGKSIFEQNTARYIKTEFNFKSTHVIRKTAKYNNGKKELEILLVGEYLAKSQVDDLERSLAKYSLSGTRLVIKQGPDAKQQLNINELREGILEQLLAKQKDRDDDTAAFPNLGGELKALYPQIVSYSLSEATINRLDSNRTDTITLFVASAPKSFKKNDEKRLTEWLKRRLNIDTVALIVVNKSN